MINDTYLKIKSKVKSKIFLLGKEIIREHLGCVRLREGKLSLIDIISLALLLQFHPPKNLKHFYEYEMLNYVKHRPSYANFLKHLRQSAGIIQHLLDLKIVQNSLYLKEGSIALLDSTKIETNKHLKRQGIERYYKKLKEDQGFNRFYFNKSDASLLAKIFANLLLAEMCI